MNEANFTRFVSKVKVPALNENEADYSKCWEWQGTTFQGYGIFWLENSNIGAHRVIYEHLYGSIIPGWHIHHKCSNKRCVNPTHLDMVTPKENSIEAGKLRRTEYCIRGHERTEENTRLRKRRDSTIRACRECDKIYWAKMKLARKYGFTSLPQVEQFLKDKGVI